MKDKLGEIVKDLKGLDIQPDNKIWEAIADQKITPKAIPLTQQTWFRVTAVSSIIVAIMAIVYLNRPAQVEILSESQNIQQIQKQPIQAQELAIVEEDKPESQVNDDIIEADQKVQISDPETVESEIQKVETPKIGNAIVEVAKVETNQLLKIEKAKTNKVIEKNNHIIDITPNVVIEKNNNPREIVVSSDTTICQNQKVTLYARGGLSYYWSNGSMDSIIQVSPSFSSVYSVRIIDHQMKEHRKAIRIDVEECTDIYVPNAFRPNGDGNNDRFRPISEVLLSYKMQIFNEQGMLVYTENEIENGWDGTYHGEQMPGGLYVYVIQYTTSLQEKKTKKGYVILLR